MIEEHVHCAQCQRPIATTIIAKGGKRKPAEVKGGMQLRAIPDEATRGVSFMPVMVPICDACNLLIEEAGEKAKARSKIVVPGAPIPSAVGGIHLVKPESDPS